MIRKTAPVSPWKYELLTLRKLRKESPFCFRGRLEDAGLKASIKKLGVLTPVIVSLGQRPAVITGHKRVFTARALNLKKIPALIVPSMGKRDAFRLHLISNWKQECSEMDRVRALALASREFHFQEDEILSIVMPLLGLPEDRSILQHYRRADGLSPAFKNWFEGSSYPLRSALSFLRFSENDLGYFVREIGSQMKLTSSQLFQTGEWLGDMMRKTGESLRKVLGRGKGLASLKAKKMDPRTKADRFFAQVRCMRFPGYAQHQEKFEKIRSDILGDTKGLRLEPVQGFEEPGFELYARVKNPAEMDRLLQKLSAERSSLNSLFEIAL